MRQKLIKKFKKNSTSILKSWYKLIQTFKYCFFLVVCYKAVCFLRAYGSIKNPINAKKRGTKFPYY
ncbi:MAG: hypothetical protein AAY43_01110 [Methanosarcina sp. 795]|nr:MAG: hypothetical protein AAY43_01110 [Methanosarcina sp. 795]